MKQKKGWNMGEQMLPFLISVASFLMTLNLFFIKRLIDKIESSSQSSYEAITKIGVLNDKIQSLNIDIKALEKDIKTLHTLEIDIAVLKKIQSNLRD